MGQTDGFFADPFKEHPRGPIPDADDVAARIMPDELIELQQAVVNAVMRGYHRDQPEEEIDLGLAELQKKTE